MKKPGNNDACAASCAAIDDAELAQIDGGGLSFGLDINLGWAPRPVVYAPPPVAYAPAPVVYPAPVYGYPYPVYC